ncbi:hypothetical protein Tco_1414952 [Tanacetum coccineum]
MCNSPPVAEDRVTVHTRVFQFLRKLFLTSQVVQQLNGDLSIERRRTDQRERGPTHYKGIHHKIKLHSCLSRIKLTARLELRNMLMKTSELRVRSVQETTLSPRKKNKVGAIAYKLELPQELSRVHNTFHVSNLKKCYADEPLAVSLDGLLIDDKLYFVEEPVEIMDREVKRLKRSRIPIIKVQWNSRRGPE